MGRGKTYKVLLILTMASFLLFAGGCNIGGDKTNLSKQNENNKVTIENTNKEEPKVQENIESTPKEAEVQKEAPKTTTPTTKAIQPKPTAPSVTPTTTPNATVAKTGRPDIPEKYAFSYLKSVEDEIVKLCNEERAKSNLKPLSINETLRQSARYKSNEMLQFEYFDHNSPITGYKPWELAKIFGYSYTAFGENIWYAKGYSQAQIEAKLIVDGWMNSEGHRKNIMNGNFGRIGVGVVYSNGNNKAEATQQFSN